MQAFCFVTIFKALLTIWIYLFYALLLTLRQFRNKRQISLTNWGTWPECSSINRQPVFDIFYKVRCFLLIKTFLQRYFCNDVYLFYRRDPGMRSTSTSTSWTARGWAPTSSAPAPMCRPPGNANCRPTLQIPFEHLVIITEYILLDVQHFYLKITRVLYAVV